MKCRWALRTFARPAALRAAALRVLTPPAARGHVRAVVAQHVSKAQEAVRHYRQRYQTAMSIAMAQQREVALCCTNVVAWLALGGAASATQLHLDLSAPDAQVVRSAWPGDNACAWHAGGKATVRAAASVRESLAAVQAVQASCDTTSACLGRRLAELASGRAQ